ncbi:MAG: hypothetical protein RL516_1605 [Bacteroidota bacterium]|jgi:hypothetical protein
MKKYFKVIMFLESILLFNFNANGQADVLGHSGLSTFYLGWNSAQFFDLNIKHEGSQNINFYTGGSQRMTILGNTNPGFVGIGITNPLSKLDVDGDINISANSAFKIDGKNVLRHANIGGTFNSLYIGIDAGNGPNNWPANTFIGFEAGKVTNTATGSLGFNTFVGYAAGKHNLDGNENTFIGANTGEFNTFGEYNTFIGIKSGQFNTDGNDNTFLGHYAGRFNQSGSNNTAVGSNALYLQTSSGGSTATYNVAIGDKSLYNTDGGIYNTALGSKSGISNTTGSYNTFLGNQANSSSANLNGATAIGFGSLVTTDNNMILGNNDVNVGIGLSGVVGGAQAKLHVQRDLQLRVVNPTGVKIQNDDVDVNGNYIGSSYGLTSTTLGSNSENFAGSFKSSNALVNYAGIFDATEPYNNVANIDNIGIKSDAQNANSNIGGLFNAANGQINYGVLSQATANRGTTNNYGVAGIAYNNDNTLFNVGVYGYAAGLPFPSPQPSLGTGSYAGYFSGDVAVTGNLWFPSDSTNKINIKPIVDADLILSQLNSYTYNFDTSKLQNVANVPQSLQFGLISQEVEAVAPNLITNTMFPPIIDSLGNVISQGQKVKMMNYVNIIPLLVSGYNKQKAINDTLKSRLDSLIQIVNQCCAANVINGQRQSSYDIYDNGQVINPKNSNQQIKQQLTVDLSDVHAILLDQNSPNPFAEKTRISWNIPEESVSKDSQLDAKLFFYNRNGSVINSVKIEQTGYGELTVYANNLSNGTYTYTLIVDGKVIDSKIMVKTK